MTELKVNKVFGARVLVEIDRPDALKIEDEPEPEPLKVLGVPSLEEVGRAAIAQMSRPRHFEPKPMPPLTARVVLVGDGCPKEILEGVAEEDHGLLLDEGDGDPSSPQSMFLKNFGKLFEQKLFSNSPPPPPTVGEGDRVLCWPYDGIEMQLPGYENMRLINVERIIARLE